jgi:hypothetical protein
VVASDVMSGSNDVSTRISIVGRRYQATTSEDIEDSMCAAVTVICSVDL